jgi:hypothetical protein
VGQFVGGFAADPERPHPRWRAGAGEVYGTREPWRREILRDGPVRPCVPSPRRRRALNAASVCNMIAAARVFRRANHLQFRHSPRKFREHVDSGPPDTSLVQKHGSGKRPGRST